MKRSKADTTRSKKTHIPSDFKRPKRKVGKRAPQKLNVTESSFKTASIQTRQQSLSTTTNNASNASGSSGGKIDTGIDVSELVSSRGKTIRECILRLNHLTANSRIAGLQGIQDAAGLSNSEEAEADDDEEYDETIHPSGTNHNYQLTRKLVTLPAIHANLSLLIPSLSKCFIDENPKVRSLATSLLFCKLIPRMTPVSTTLRPFLSVILAYLKSALHSLDVDIRYDGCVALNLFCSTRVVIGVIRDIRRMSSSSEVSSTFGGCYRALEEALPAFVKLLEDVGSTARVCDASTNGGGGGGGTISKKKQNKRDVKSSSKVVGVLRCLVSLFRLLYGPLSSSPSSLDVSTFSSLPTTPHRRARGGGGGNETNHSIEERNTTTHYHGPNGPSLLPSLDQDHLSLVPGGTRSNALVVLRNKRSGVGVSEHTKPVVLKGVGDLNLLGFVPNPVSIGGNAQRNALQPRQQRQIQSNSSYNNNNNNNNTLSITIHIHLLSKLRDRFVEVIQRGRAHNGLSLSLPNLEELSLLVSSLRLVRNASYRCGRPSPATTTGCTTQTKQLVSLVGAIQQLFLESLPVWDDAGNRDNVDRYDYMNASLCCAVGEYGSDLVRSTNGGGGGGSSSKALRIRSDEPNGLESVWVDAVFGYLLPRLENGVSDGGTGSEEEEEEEEEVKDGKGNDTNNDNYYRNTIGSNTRVTLLRVIGKLLLRDETLDPGGGRQRHVLSLGSCPLEDNLKRMQLLETFGEAFFRYGAGANTDNDNNATTNNGTLVRYKDGMSGVVCRSPEGRKAAALLTTLLTQHLLLRSNHNQRFGTRESTIANIESEGNKDDDPEWLDTWDLLTKMASVLPLYLESWRGNFPKLSSTVLATLLSITRQSTCSNGAKTEDTKPDDPIGFESSTDRLCLSLRGTIPGLFRLSKNKSVVVSIADGRVYKYRLSVFEQMSEAAQKLTLGIVGMLRCPSVELITSLSQICVHKRCRSRPGTVAAGEGMLTAGLSDEMIDYAMGVVHSVRRTVSLQLYLTFLVKCTGIDGARYRKTEGGAVVRSDRRRLPVDGPTSAIAENEEARGGSEDGGAPTTKSTPSENDSAMGTFDVAFVTSYDGAIARSCRYLCICGGGVKLVRMLGPVLSSWLGADEGSKNRDGEEHGPSSVSPLAGLKLRASLCVLSCFALHGVEVTCDGMDTVLVDAVCKSMLSIPFSREIESDTRTNAVFVKLLSPLVALLSCEATLLCTVLKESEKQIQSDKDNVQLNESFMNSLLTLIRSEQLQAVFRIPRVAQTLKEMIALIEIVSIDGPLDTLGRNLHSEVQMLLGYSF